MKAQSQVDLAEFTRRATSMALVRSAGDLFSLLTRSFELPARWAALVTREAGDAVYVRAGGQIRHDGVKDVLLVRTGPVEVEVPLASVHSADGYSCDVHITLQVELVTEPAELKAFRDTVMGSAGYADLESLEGQLLWPLQSAVQSFADSRTAEVLVTGAEPEALQAVLDEKLKPALFSAGLARCGTPRVTIESPGYAEVQATRAQEARRLDQHAAREQVRQAVRQGQDAHVAHLGGLLDELGQLADRSPDLSVADLVKTFSERDRGQLYQALWQALPEQAARWIVAASGEELWFFEPGTWDKPVRRVRLAGPAGPLRSVTTARDDAGTGVLLVGAARGVHVIEPEADTPRATYLFNFPGSADLESGVNAAAIGSGRVFATHSQIGLVVWPADQPAASVRMLTELTADARTVRHAQVADNRLWFAVDASVISVPLDQIGAASAIKYDGRPARITALVAQRDAVYAGNRDGEILRWALDRDQRDEPEVLRSASGQSVESIEVLETGGVLRLVFADQSTALNALVVGDAYACRYEGQDQRVRRAAIAGDWLVAINDRRDRLLCWRPHEPLGPAGTIPVSRLSGRSVQDVCVVTCAGDPPVATA